MSRALQGQSWSLGTWQCSEGDAVEGSALSFGRQRQKAHACTSQEEVSEEISPGHQSSSLPVAGREVMSSDSVFSELELGGSTRIRTDRGKSGCDEILGTERVP